MSSVTGDDNAAVHACARVRTGPQPPLQRLLMALFPPLAPRAVARASLAAAERGRAWVAVPEVLGLVPAVLRCLPADWWAPILAQAGGTTGMDGFVGRR